MMHIGVYLNLAYSAWQKSNMFLSVKGTESFLNFAGFKLEIVNPKRGKYGSYRIGEHTGFGN